MNNVLTKVTPTLNLVLFVRKLNANHDNNMSGKHELRFLIQRGKKVSLITEFALITWLKGTIFFPRVILLCLYREPQPKKLRRPHTTGPKPHQLKTPTPKTQYKTPTPKPQTTINEPK